MQVTAQQIFRELEEGKWKPFYLVVGDEPFQAGELFGRLKAFFLKDENSRTFNFESWDGEHLDGSGLLASLNTLPGLFDAGDSLRLIALSRMDKAAPSTLETLEPYLRNPSPTTCFVMLASKVNRRKGWFKAIDEKGYVLEVSEPYDREWPKWQTYFERKVKKRFESGVWESLVDSANRSLSLVWAELQKVAIFVGERPTVTLKDWTELSTGPGAEDVFAFAEDVVFRRAFEALRRFQILLRGGENEIKLLSILVRQFRMVEQTHQLAGQGITDSKTIASRIGVPPFLVSKISQQARAQTAPELRRARDLLAECDFRLKTGDGSLFENFLVPYFSAHV